METQEMLNVKGKSILNIRKNLKQSKLGQKLKTGALAPARGAYLALLKLNVFGAATHLKDLQTKDANKYKNSRDSWYTYGGNRTLFDKVVTKGAKKKAIMFGFKKKGADGTWSIEGIAFDQMLNAAGALPWMGNADPDIMYRAADGVWFSTDGASVGAKMEEFLNFVIPTAVVTATPIIISMVKAGGKPSGMDDSTAASLTAEAAATKATTDAALAEQAEINKTLNGAEPPEDRVEGVNALPVWGWVAIGAGLLGIGGFVFWKMKGSKK